MLPHYEKVQILPPPVAGHDTCDPPQILALACFCSANSEKSNREVPFCSLFTPGLGGVVTTGWLGDSGVRWGRRGRPRLSPPAAGGLGTLRRGSDLRQSREPTESRGAGSGGGQDPGQVGDGSGEIELGGGLVTPHVPGVPQTQLRQPAQAVLHVLAGVAIGCESPTVLERAGVLQQGFLRVQSDLPPAARFRRPHGGGGADRPYRVPRQSGNSAGGARSPVAVV